MDVDTEKFKFESYQPRDDDLEIFQAQKEATY